MRKELVNKLKKKIKKTYNNIVYSTKPPMGCKTTKEFLLEKGSSHRYKLIEPQHQVIRRPPQSMNLEVHCRFEEEYSRYSPETFIATVSQGRVYGFGVVITPDNYVLKDVSLEFNNHHYSHSVCVSGNLRTPQYIDKNVAVLSSSGDDGYFHWLYDSIARLQFIDTNEVDLFYVNNEKKFQKEYLELFGIPEQKILPAGKMSHIQAKNLIIPSLPGFTGNITQSSCLFFRNLLKYFGKSQDKKRRIYISRKNAANRKVLNQAEVVSLLDKYDFEIVQLENLSVKEQIKLFSASEAVVGPHGAGLSNLVFCPPGAKVIEFFPPTYVNVCYWALSEQCQLKYYYQIGDSEVLHSNYFSNPQNIYIDIGRLSRLLAQIL